jgi:hypothetical protein
VLTPINLEMTVRLALAVLSLSFALASSAGAETFTFIALGDAPYGKPEEVYAPYKALIGEINSRKPDLVMHIGDTKSGSTPCSDQMLNEQLDFLNSFEAPTLYTPGDNEWTDCHRKAAGGFDPLDRLNYLRTTYFKAPDKSFGKMQIAVKSQREAGYPENVTILHKGIQFVTAHVVGSNNNFETRDIKAVEEFFARDAANIKWLKQGFADAKANKAAALVLGIQADMFEFDWNAFDDEAWLRHSGFKSFGDELIKQANDFAKPVLLVFGDSHHFRVFRPFPKTAPLIQGLEVYGESNIQAVEIAIDTARAMPFSISTVINPARPLAGEKPE